MAAPAAPLEHLSAAIGPRGRRCWIYDSEGGSSPDPAPAPADVLWFLLDGEVWAEQHGIGGMLHQMREHTRSLARHRAASAPVSTQPRVRAILIDSGGEQQRWDELGADPAFADELANEWLPWARDVFGALPPRERCCVAGQSLGGLTALRCGTRHPGSLGMIVAQSPSLWVDSPEVSPFDADATPRFIMEVGTHEARLLESNREFARVLRAAGADVALRELEGGHDYACWRGGLLDALAELT